MSDDEKVAEGATPKPGSRTLTIAIVAICLIAGGGAGVFAVAPALGGTSAGVEEEEEEGGSSHGSGGHGEASGPYIYSVDNVVLNPLGTNGTRFLLVTAAFEVGGEDMVEQMRGRDDAIRDLLNRSLGARTVEQLADLDQRESLREDIRLELEAMFTAGSVKKVYLPQFVIQ